MAFAGACLDCACLDCFYGDWFVSTSGNDTTGDGSIESPFRSFEKAIDTILKSARLPPAVRVGWCLEAYLSLYNKMKTTGDYAGARAAVQEIVKLTQSDKISAAPPSGYEQDIASEEVNKFIDDMMEIEWKK